MKKKKLPIFIELTIGSLLIIISILTTYTVIQLITFADFSSDYEKDYLVDKYNEINSLAKNINIEISEKGFEEYLNQIAKGEGDEYIRIYSSDKVYYENNEKILDKVKLQYEDKKIDVDVEVINLDTYGIISAPLTINGDKYTIQIIKETDIFHEFIESYLPTLLFVLILGIVLSVIGAIYVSRNFIKRLKTLSTTMNEIKEKGINRRAEISGLNDEIDKINIVFNSMMDEVEETFEEQGRFVSDASHELKTPLTALQGHLSMLKRWGKNDEKQLEKSLNICLSEVERLKKIVNDMLLLSKAEKSQVDLENIEAINPKALIDELVEQYRILNPKVIYDITIEDDIKIRIDVNDLKQLIIIFIDNAIKYNDKDDIKISISLKMEQEKVKLEVMDNGIGIPKDELSKVMKRFYKVDKSRVNNNSFGIGLSIAKRIIENYNAEINIESELGEYTKVVVLFNR